uniref:CARD domain-containing protein n=1 Tax=Neogobius melanostomus TaxID=47308 RepID=A0A8C6SPE7_9GOBI
MPPKNARVAIWNALKNLEESNFRDFCDELAKPEGKPRIWPSDVEKKSRTEVLKVLVSRCSSGAVDRAITTLRDIGCNGEADELGEMDLHSASRSKSEAGLTMRPSLNATHTGTNRSSLSPAEWHFVDWNRHELIYRVSNVAPILDHLRKEKVLKDEQYDEAMTKSTTQDKMRFLFSGPLKSAGDRAKDVLLSALKEYERYLIMELEIKG